MRARLFGASTSEKIDSAQLQLALDELGDEVAAQQAAQELEINAYTRSKKTDKVAQSKLPENIETERVELIPDEVRANPDAYVQIGEEVTEKLEVLPMKFVRKIIARLKFKKKDQIDAIPFCVALPAQLIDRSLATPSLMTLIIVSKYVDHLPLYRLEQIFKRRFDINISRKRMSDWIGYIVDNWLSLIYYSIKSDLLKENYLQVDETPIKYIDHDYKGSSKKGYLWVFANPQGNILFDWQLGRGHKATKEILDKFKGFIQCDGYRAYDTIADQNHNITLVGCWAHARRYFYQAYEHGSIEAAQYLLPIRRLYAVEKVDPEELAQARKNQSSKILKQIKDQLDRDSDRYIADQKMSKAIAYTKGQWSKLTRYIDHPEIKIDNNMIEAGIRPTKLGAKNWLFIGHPDAGHRTAMLYTILESCKRHQINVTEYLNDVLSRLPNMTNFEAEKADLTPEKWKQKNS